jgi:hypothetical protein
MTKSNAARISFFAIIFAAAAATSASATECNEDYQIVQGRPISTPYCRDDYLAAVARTYGYKISDIAIRNNPSRKEEICMVYRQRHSRADSMRGGSAGFAQHPLV